MDSVATPVQWAYSTGATAMAPPGLRFAGGQSYVYAVSNDSILHSMNGGLTGGDWPASWKPYQLGGPAQSRPPVVSFQVGSALGGAAFLGSQDGNVYAVDAVDGSEEWKRHISTGVQAAPAGHFQAFYAGAFDIVITGTRDPNGPNQLVALDVHTGSPVWSFDNSLAQGGDGKEIGIISGSASIDYPMKWAFFASHTRGGANGSNRTLWCVDFSSGSPVLRWSLALGNIDGSPVLWGNAVYVGTNSGVLNAVDRYALTGTINWSYPIGDGAIKAFVFPQFPTNRLLVSTTGKVTSVEDLISSYNVNWQLNSTDIPGPSTPVFVPGTGKILVGSSDGHLYQMDAFTPLPTTRVQLGDGSSAVGVPTVDISKSMIYVGTDEGVIYGITFPLP
jgi:outer membrane protein assembly factor BamB